MATNQATFRTIKRSSRKVQTLESQDGFFVLSEAPRQHMLEHLYGCSMSGPFPLDDSRFSSVTN